MKKPLIHLVIGIINICGTIIPVFATSGNNSTELDLAVVNIGSNLLSQIYENQKAGDTNDRAAKIRAITCVVSNALCDKGGPSDKTYALCEQWLDTMWRLCDDWNMYTDALEVRRVLHEVRRKLYRREEWTEEEVCDEASLLWKKGDRLGSLNILQGRFVGNTSNSLRFLLARFADDLDRTDLALDIYADVGNDVVTLWCKGKVTTNGDTATVNRVTLTGGEGLALWLSRELSGTRSSRTKRGTVDIIAELRRCIVAEPVRETP